MKRIRIVAIIAIIAIFFASCDPKPGKAALTVPEWAEGDYTGTVIGMESTLKITPDSFRIDIITEAGVPFMTVDSAADGTTIEDQKINEDEKTWNIILDGVTLSGNTINDINVTITESGENLNVIVTVPGIGNIPEINFKPIA